MLNDLSIKNFAIIDELHVSFHNGLNILSGETGTGKSIIIGAVSLLLGDRAAAEMIRTNAETAMVEALFDITHNEKLKERIKEMGFAAEDEVVIRRVISRSGKNKALINGQMATLANLTAISELLINICGQHEHQLILDKDNHIEILDEFGGCLPSRALYEEAYNRYQQLNIQKERLENLRRSREEKKALIEYQLKEIQDVAPQPEEDRALAEEKKVLVHIQKLTDYAGRAYDLLYGETNSVLEKMQDAQHLIKEIKKIDSNLKLSETDLENSFHAMQEAALTLRDYSKNLFFDPERLVAIDERLEMINRLKRKHGGSLENVFCREQEMEKELLFVSNVEEELNQLTQKLLSVKNEMLCKAKSLSHLRTQAAIKLKDAVNIELQALNMNHASFLVNFIKKPDDGKQEAFGFKGGDELEFYLAANIGEEPKALNKTASGGELSRIVLALKNVVSQTGSVDTLIFDEVDSGIGGATAEIVGRKLKDISANHQIICITHLPQIACYGDSHARVTKKVTGGRTTTVVDKLDNEQRVEEISRMLGGIDLTKKARDHAREMLEKVKGSFLENGGEKRNAKKSAHR